MTAKLDRSEPISFVKPLSAIPFDWRALIERVWREADCLSHRHDLPLEAHAKAMQLAADATKLHNLSEGILPGMEAISSKRREPTEEEVQLYALKEGIGGDDARVFFRHMKTNGWTTNGRPIKSWQHCLLLWRDRGYLESQKRKLTSNGQRVETINDVVWRDAMKAATRGL